MRQIGRMFWTLRCLFQPCVQRRTSTQSARGRTVRLRASPYVYVHQCGYLTFFISVLLAAPFTLITTLFLMLRPAKGGCIMFFVFGRGLFIIDPNGVVRQVTINDLPVGRSVEETLRLVKAFQFVEKHGEGLYKSALFCSGKNTLPTCSNHILILFVLFRCELSHICTGWNASKSLWSFK